MKTFFWILFGIDALVLAGFGFFFVLGIADGSVSAFNLALWLGILGALGAVLFGAWVLRGKSLTAWALALLSLVAVPAVGALLLFLVILISNPRWN